MKALKEALETLFTGLVLALGFIDLIMAIMIYL